MTTAPKAIDYSMQVSDASELAGITLLPLDVRRQALQVICDRDGPGRLVEMFAQFIGIANSVVHNQRDAIEVFAIVEGGDHPHMAEQYNFPTVFGAVNGVILAASAPDQGNMCDGCAYRLGSLANQSPITTCDAEWTCSDARPGSAFLCHDVDGDEKPHRTCRGWAQHRTNSRRAASSPGDEGFDVRPGAELTPIATDRTYREAPIEIWDWHNGGFVCRDRR